MQRWKILSLFLSVYFKSVGRRQTLNKLRHGRWKRKNAASQWMHYTRNYENCFLLNLNQSNSRLKIISMLQVVRTGLNGNIWVTSGTGYFDFLISLTVAMACSACSNEALFKNSVLRFIIVERDGILFEPVLLAAKARFGAELSWLAEDELRQKSL